MFLLLKFAVCTNLVFGLVDTHPIFCLASFIVLIDTSKFSHFSCKSSRICLPVSSSFSAIALSMNFIWSKLSFGVWEPRGKSVVTPCCYNFLRILQRYSWHFKSSWGKNTVVKSVEYLHTLVIVDALEHARAYSHMRMSVTKCACNALARNSRYTHAQLLTCVWSACEWWFISRNLLSLIEINPVIGSVYYNNMMSM